MAQNKSLVTKAKRRGLYPHVLSQLYWDEKQTQAMIADEFGFDQQNISTLMVHWAIPTRDMSEALTVAAEMGRHGKDTIAGSESAATPSQEAPTADAQSSTKIRAQDLLDSRSLETYQDWDLVIEPEIEEREDGLYAVFNSTGENRSNGITTANSGEICLLPH